MIFLGAILAYFCIGAFIFVSVSAIFLVVIRYIWALLHHIFHMIIF